MGSAVEERKFTYADYLTWPEEERWEIIGGTAFCMIPAPNLKHQSLVVTLSRILSTHFLGKKCRLFVAPTDLVLDESNVVQPDLLVVCDENKLTETNVQGAPDLVVEILSPSTRLKDKREKKALYERAGVREYLVVYPEEEMVEQYRFIDGRYASDVFNWDQTLPLFAFPGLEVNLREVFEKVTEAEKAETAP